MINVSDILNARILVVDDLEANVQLLEQMLSNAGYLCVTSTRDPTKVCELYLKNRYDLVLLDLQMPGMDGFQVIEALKALEPGSYVPVLVITAQPGHKLRALEAGAKDFIAKPFDLVEVKTRIHNLLEVRLLYKAFENQNKILEQSVRERTGELTTANVQLRREIEERKLTEKSLQSAYVEIQKLQDRLQAENVYLRQEVARDYNFGAMIGQSEPLSQVFLQVGQVAPMNATVLLLGETGTGKGMVARAIHGASTRKHRPLITVNCATLPAALIESELFGREKGAFTGSDTRQIGRFELADGGTIFLDEIGELPLELQSKLLRVIQDGEFERLGSSRTTRTDVRIIAATNRNLVHEIRDGSFREDLYYRLNVFPITLPPLRERREDIPLLVNYFIAKLNKKIGKQVETVPKETMNILRQYDWPGNVRELESVLERAVIVSSGTALQVLDRFDSFRQAGGLAGQDIKVLAALEQELIRQALGKTGWRIDGKKGAAVILGLNPSTLRFRMQKYGICRQ